MEIKHTAVSGTEDSGDLFIEISPGNGNIELELTSKVFKQYGNAIRASIMDTLHRLEVSSAKLTVKDKGALDHTIRARIASAVFRSADMTENLPWRNL